MSLFHRQQDVAFSDGIGPKTMERRARCTFSIEQCCELLLLLLLVVDLMNANHVMQEMVFLEAEKEEFEGRRNDYYRYVLTDAGKTTHHGAVINVHLFIFLVNLYIPQLVCEA